MRNPVSLTLIGRATSIHMRFGQRLIAALLIALAIMPTLVPAGISLAAEYCECIRYVSRYFGWPAGVWGLEENASLRVIDNLRARGVSVTVITPSPSQVGQLVGSAVTFAPGAFGANST